MALMKLLKIGSHPQKDVEIFPICVELQYCLITMTHLLNMAQTFEKSAYSLRDGEGDFVVDLYGRFKAVVKCNYIYFNTPVQLQFVSINYFVNKRKRRGEI